MGGRKRPARFQLKRLYNLKAADIIPSNPRRRGRPIEPIVTRANTRAILERFDLHTKKRLGQHYLVDGRVLEKILRAGDVSEQDCVLEIGPGLGTVTQALAERAGQVLAVEVDARSVEVLGALFADTPNVRVVRGDILKTDVRELLAPYAGQRLKVVANLPYYITTPVLMRLLEDGPAFECLTVMVQREVAERLCASPGSGHYGALSLAAQYCAAVEIAAYVPPNCFMPRPKVDSAVVRLAPHGRPPVDTDRAALFRAVKLAFAQRRKTLANALTAARDEREQAGGRQPAGDAIRAAVTKEDVADALTGLGLRADARGETLSLEQFAALTDALGKRGVSL